MIHMRDEGQLIRRGLNLYPLSSASSRGFILSFGGVRLHVRWSIPQQRLRVFWARRG